MKAIVLLAAIIPSLAAAQSLQPFEVLLLPLPPGRTPGAYGTNWVVEQVVHIEGEEPIVYGLVGCRISFCTEHLGPGSFVDLFPWPVVPVQAPGIERFHIALNARDTSRADYGWGTEIPVVHERQFRRDVVQLLDIPANERYRRALRLYGFADQPGATITLRVEVFDMGAEMTGEKRLLATRSYVITPRDLAFVHYGDVLITDFDGVFPEALEAEGLRIKITRTAGDGRFWALATATNNETQIFTTFSPK